jgi:chemotaxis receptor (MCP) glutamine deamidase CheD
MAQIELATERVRERIARIELRSTKVQLQIAWVKFATVGLGSCVAVVVFLLRL